MRSLSSFRFRKGLSMDGGTRGWDRLASESDATFVIAKVMLSNGSPDSRTSPGRAGDHRMTKHDEAPAGTGASSEILDGPSDLNATGSGPGKFGDGRNGDDSGIPPWRDRSIRIVSANEILTWPDPEYLVEGLVQVEGTSEVYGETGCGKTFVVLSWCMAIASGTPWLGRKVIQGPVIYVGAEGVGGLPKRLRALKAEHKVDALPADLYVIPRAVNLFSLPSWSQETIQDTQEVLELCRKRNIHPCLVVFDTYARSMVGADENSAKDVGLVLANIDRIRLGLGTATMIVHHPGKTRGSSDRGSGALPASIDSKIRLTKSSGNLTLVVEKQKNFEHGLTIMLRLEPLAESLVVRPGMPNPSVAGSGMTSTVDNSARIQDDLLTALRQEDAGDRLPIIQTSLLKLVPGNASAKAAALRSLGDDPDSGVEITKSGNKNLISLGSTLPLSDSDSPLPPP